MILTVMRSGIYFWLTYTRFFFSPTPHAELGGNWPVYWTTLTELYTSPEFQFDLAIELNPKTLVRLSQLRGIDYFSIIEKAQTSFHDENFLQTYSLPQAPRELLIQLTCIFFTTSYRCFLELKWFMKLDSWKNQSGLPKWSVNHNVDSLCSESRRSLRA